MQSLEHSPLREPRGSSRPMAGYHSATSLRSSSLMSTSSIERAFDAQTTTSRQRSLSSSGTQPDMPRRSLSAPPASSPLRQPPVTAQSATATRSSMRLQSQQQQQQRSTSASRLPSAPSQQRAPTQSSAAAPTSGTGRRPAPSSSPAPAAPSQVHQAKKPRRR